MCKVPFLILFLGEAIREGILYFVGNLESRRIPTIWNPKAHRVNGRGLKNSISSPVAIGISCRTFIGNPAAANETHLPNNVPLSPTIIMMQSGAPSSSPRTIAPTHYINIHDTIWHTGPPRWIWTIKNPSGPNKQRHHTWLAKRRTRYRSTSVVIQSSFLRRHLDNQSGNLILRQAKHIKPILIQDLKRLLQINIKCIPRRSTSSRWLPERKRKRKHWNCLTAFRLIYFFWESAKIPNQKLKFSHFLSFLDNFPKMVSIVDVNAKFV